MVSLVINDKKITVEEGLTILQAAMQNNILIPHLCCLEGVHHTGSCRICVVEVEDEKTLQASCMLKVKEGMVVRTNTAKVRKIRKLLYELMLSDHQGNCPGCARNQTCEFRKLGEMMQINTLRFEGAKSKAALDESSPAIIHDTSKCVLCGRCVTVCNEMQGLGVLNIRNRGFKTAIGPACGQSLNAANCTYCGLCTVVCPTGALREKDSIQDVWNALLDRDKRVVVLTAPAVRAALGEEFGLEPGKPVTGKMIMVLRNMGIDKILDTDTVFDTAIMEASKELLDRLSDTRTEKNTALPMMAGFCPGFQKYVEDVYPKKLEHMSACKSPHMMLGDLVKAFYAKEAGVDPKHVFVVSAMPCTAGKYEIARPEMSRNGLNNVDAVLTTRELARMINESGVEFSTLEEDRFDDPLDMPRGSSETFSMSGGVAKTVLFTIYKIATGRELLEEQLQFKPVTDLNSVMAVNIRIENPLEEYGYLNGVDLKIAMTSGLRGAKALMDQIVRGESPYHFAEVMVCPGGCINGGGQPRTSLKDKLKRRMEVISISNGGKPPYPLATGEMTSPCATLRAPRLRGV